MDTMTIEQWAISHETSREIAEAIAYIAVESRGMQAIWSDPSREEVIAIAERVTGNHLDDAEDFNWGEMNLQEVLDQFI